MVRPTVCTEVFCNCLARGPGVIELHREVVRAMSTREAPRLTVVTTTPGSGYLPRFYESIAGAKSVEGAEPSTSITCDRWIE